MTTKQLLPVALLGAPFLGIGVYAEAYVSALLPAWWTGAWGIVYITGWMASMEVMRRLNLTGTDRFGRIIVRIVLVTLTLANLSSVWEAINPTYKPSIYWVLDTCWPLSNLLMLAVGVAVLRARRLRGWQRWVPLVVGFWFPLTMAVSRTPIVLHFSNMYSVFFWTLMALVLWRRATEQPGAQVISGIAIRDESPHSFQP